MLNKLSTATWGAYAPYLFVNLLFVLKYTQRITPYFVGVGAVYVLVGILLLYLLHAFVAKVKQPLVWLSAIVGVALIGGVYLQYAIDPYSLQVDRWSALHNFLQYMLNGEYPYAANTHLGGFGSPFPIWQLFHLPFYLLGNVGLSIFVVTLLFVVVVCKCYGTKMAVCVSALLFLCPAYWYEVAVRSDLMTNLLLVSIVVMALHKYKISLSNHLCLLGLLVGCLASTRLIALIPMAVLYGKEFLQLSLKDKCVFIATVLFVFALTFLPFLMWDGSTLLFFEYNPFVLQTRQGSALVFVLFALIAIGMVLYADRKKISVYLVTGGLLNLLVLFAMVEKMYLMDAWTKLFTPMFDITYFSAALPFYCLCVGWLHAK